MVDNKQQWKAWLYLSPAIVLLLIFTVWPIFNTLRMAFLNGYSQMGEIVYVRYRKLQKGNSIPRLSEVSRQHGFAYGAYRTHQHVACIAHFGVSQRNQTAETAFANNLFPAVRYKQYRNRYGFCRNVQYCR